MSLVFMSNQSTDGLQETKIVFGKHELVFDTSMYAKATQNSLTATEAFKAFNAFLAWMGPKVGSVVFEHYKNIATIFNDVMDPDIRNRQLVREVQLLYNALPEKQVMHWLLFHSGLQPAPGSTNVIYEGAAEERTYLTEDYKKLMGLSLALRPMIPVWGHYIALTGGSSGSDFKEYNALALIDECWLIQSDACHRLLSYLENSIEKSTDINSAVLGGLGTEEIPNYLLGLSLIRRLAVGNLYPEKKEDSLIANTYNYIFKNVMGGFGRQFVGGIREKRNPEQSDSDSISIPENYKIKQTIPDGELELSIIYSERPFDVIQKIELGVSPDKLAACLAAINPILQADILEHYVILTQYIVAPAVAPESILNLTKLGLLNMIAVTQAVLWHWEFYDLAALITATPIISDDPDVFDGCDSRSRISEVLKDQLVELFPHFVRSGGNNPPPLEKQRRQNNPGAKAVEEIAKNIVYNEWHLNCPSELLALSSAIPPGRRMNTPIDIKNQLARLIIKIVNQK